ncbi:hypothetical protein WUBG_13633 [Wuchereria bancrofti]|uniref:Uncharacterized protein n=1 Tax=Wuchereria bancrofti TaxID=6293 RepID=J9DZS8_WUCBA|nr:hypothetical protein WUBG_13633 [Wuchereria bancrofti]
MIENQSKILKGPVIIEILLDVTTLKLAQPSELQDKPVSTSISAVVTKINAASPVFISAELGNASDRQVVMYNALIKCISSREYILNITDDKLFRFPVAFIELFYPNLSPARYFCAAVRNS